MIATPLFVGFEPMGTQAAKCAELVESSALSNEVDRVLARLSAASANASSLLSLSISVVGGGDTQRFLAIREELGELLPIEARPVVSFVPAKSLVGSQLRLQAIAVPSETTRDQSSARFPEVAIAGKWFAATSSLKESGSIIEQTEVALSSVRRYVEELGGTLDDVINLGVYFVDRGSREEWAEAALMRAASFSEPGPCATGISLESLAIAGAQIQFTMLGVAGARESGDIRDAWPESPWEWPFRLPYRHGNRVGRLCIIGGQSSRGDDMTISTPTDVAVQATMTVTKVGAVVAELGGTLHDVVRLTAHYVADGDSDGEVVRERIIAAMPHENFELTLIGVHKLAHPEMLVEIDGEANIRNVYTAV